MQWSSTNPSKQIWRINSCWELAIPLQSIVVSMQPSLIQDLAWVLLAKSKELMTHKDYQKSIHLLKVLDADAKEAGGVKANNIYKLCKLISWEELLIRIVELFDKWPQTQEGKTIFDTE